MINTQDINPIGTRILLQLETIKTETESGLFIPHKKDQSSGRKGTVLAINPNNELELHVGQEIFFDYVMCEPFDDARYLVFCKEEHIIGVLE